MLDSGSGFAPYSGPVFINADDGCTEPTAHPFQHTCASQLLLQLSESDPRHRSQWVFSLDLHRPFGPDLKTFNSSHRPKDSDKGPREIFQVI